MMPTNEIIEIGFLVVIGAALARLIFQNDSSERVFQKIIGGFAVFIIALLSDNAYVMTVSLFIGGLIIASEHFMKILVAILRADSSDIKDLVRIESATREEVEEKLQVEQKEVQEVLSNTERTQNGGGGVAQSRVTFEERGHIEKKVNEALIKHFGAFYEPNAKVYYQDRAMVFDGIIRNKISDDSLSVNKYTEATAVEIKYLPSLTSFSVELLISRTLGRILGSFEKMNLLIVLVTKDISSEEAWEAYQRVIKKYPRIYLAIYNYNSTSSSVEKMVMRYY